MFDIGAIELFVVAVVALIVVGPRELPALLRTVTGFIRKIRELSSEFRSGVSDLASEIEKEVDPFGDLREQEGLRPGMSPREITEHIMSNKSNAPENTIHNDQNEDKTHQNMDESSLFDEVTDVGIEKTAQPETEPDLFSSIDEKSREGLNEKSDEKVKTEKKIDEGQNDGA